MARLIKSFLDKSMAAIAVPFFIPQNKVGRLLETVLQINY